MDTAIITCVVPIRVTIKSEPSSPPPPFFAAPLHHLNHLHHCCCLYNLHFHLITARLLLTWSSLLFHDHLLLRGSQNPFVAETQVSYLNWKEQSLLMGDYSQGTQTPKDAPSLISTSSCYSFNFLLETDLCPCDPGICILASQWPWSKIIFIAKAQIANSHGRSLIGSVWLPFGPITMARTVCSCD